MKKNPAIFVVVLTLIFSLYVFTIWIPTQVDEEALILFKDVQVASVTVTPNLDNTLSDDLLKYIQEKRVAANSESDVFDDDEIARKVREFEDEKVEDADDLLEKRFGKTNVIKHDSAADDEDFEVPMEMRAAVNFWIHVFGVYDKNHVVFYNQDDVGVVYSVLDFSELSSMSDKARDAVENQMVHQETERLTGLLQKVSLYLGRPGTDELTLTPEEQRLLALLRASQDHIATSASELRDSLTYRQGYSQRMREAIVTSGKYMPEMQRIFSAQGLPVELTVLPFIESAFNLKAYSSAGASGLWQFIEATGRSYLRIDEYVDERYDPVLATYAAASHMAREFKLLKSWPLTINAYNTGPRRMMEAVKTLKTADISKIIKYFKGSGYGFDSRNYYPEFLAALEVYRNTEHYFGDVHEAPEQDYDFIKMFNTTNVMKVARAAGLDETTLAEFNPGLRANVLSGAKELPKGYLLKIPPTSKDDMLVALRDLQRDERDDNAYHVVKKGEKLDDIAVQYGLMTEDLETENDLAPGDKLEKGDVLKLPQSNDAQEVSVKRPIEDQGLLIEDLRVDSP